MTLTKDDTERVEREVRLLSPPPLPRPFHTHSLFSIQRRNIEILKIRFGEAALQVCEVMLKDMTDSKRIDGHVQSQRAVSLLFLSPVRGSTISWGFDKFILQSIVHPTIISRHFWPSLETSEMIMPGQFQQFVLQLFFSSGFFR